MKIDIKNQQKLEVLLHFPPFDFVRRCTATKHEVLRNL